MPRGLNHRRYHVEADGRLGRFYQNRPSAWEAVAGWSKAPHPTPADASWPCNILERFPYRL